MQNYKYWFLFFYRFFITKLDKFVISGLLVVLKCQSLKTQLIESWLKIDISKCLKKVHENDQVVPNRKPKYHR